MNEYVPNAPLAAGLRPFWRKLGINRTYVGTIEQGEQNVGLLTVNRLALALSENAVGFVPCCPETLPKKTGKE